jgi:CheY-like chemotaxis protein
MADRTQIQQVLMNLLTNASEALGGRPGTISLRTRAGHKSEDELRELFPDSALPAGEYVLLEVEDTGCGMSEESLQRLFDPFFTTKVAGRGLGMSAVLGIVRGHRGAIRVRSTLNVGSSFVIAIPATEPRVVRRESTLAPPAIRAKGTVLVVDDESFIRKTVAMLLGELGFSTIEASDGAEAVDRFAEKQSEIVLVILDMTMPVLSGVEALRAIRGMAPDVPVILSSGYSEDEIEQREHTVEPSAFLQKPYRIEDLERALRQVLPAR